MEISAFLGCECYLTINLGQSVCGRLMLVWFSNFASFPFLQLTNERNELSEWSVSVLCGHPWTRILLKSDQRGSTRSDGEEITVLCTFHRRLSAAEENEIGARADRWIGQTSTGIHNYVSASNDWIRRTIFWSSLLFYSQIWTWRSTRMVSCIRGN